MTSEEKQAPEKSHWLDAPRNVNKIVIALYAVCALSAEAPVCTISFRTQEEDSRLSRCSAPSMKPASSKEITFERTWTQASPHPPPDEVEKDLRTHVVPARIQPRR